MKEIKAQKLHNLVDENRLNPKYIIDIREQMEIDVFNIEGTTNIDMNKLAREPEKYLNKNEQYYIMCASGGRSLQMTFYLNELGYDVINVEGGINSY